MPGEAEFMRDRCQVKPSSLGNDDKVKPRSRKKDDTVAYTRKVVFDVR